MFQNVASWIAVRAFRENSRRGRCRPLDIFIPEPDVRERHATDVAASAATVMGAVRTTDIYSIAPVRFIFRMREMLMGVEPPPRVPRPFLEEMQGLGWRCLVDRPESLFVAGAACRPWLADVVFRPIPTENFAAYDDPNQVKIAWAPHSAASQPKPASRPPTTRLACASATIGAGRGLESF